MIAASIDTASLSIADRLDRVPLARMHLIIVAVTSLGFAFDLLEVALGNVLSAVFSTGEAAVGSTQLSWLLAAMYLGAIIGAPSFGWLADRVGRKHVLTFLLALLCAASLGAAFSNNVTTLTGLRFISGLALGAYPPLVIAYLTDILPPRRRGLLIMVVAGLASLGPLGMVFFVRWLTPLQPVGLEAWRWAFLVGSAGSLLGAALFSYLPESPRWLSARGKIDAAETAITRLLRSGALAAGATPPPPPTTDVKFDRPALLPMSLLYFLNPWAGVAFPVLMGAILIEKGFALSDTLLYVGVSTFGPVLGTFVAGTILDRIERPVAIACWAAVMLLSAGLFAWTNNPALLMASGVVFSMFASIQAPTLTLYGAEAFPTISRAGITSALWAINRTAAAAGLLVLLPLLRSAGVLPMILVILGTLARWTRPGPRAALVRAGV